MLHYVVAYEHYEQYEHFFNMPSGSNNSVPFCDQHNMTEMNNYCLRLKDPIFSSLS